MQANNRMNGRAMNNSASRNTKMSRVYAIESWCVGCKRCEVACRVAHSETKDPVKAYTHEEGLLPSRITVEGDRYLSIAVNCRHCANPRCIEGCISGAMQKDPSTGTVTSDPDRCVGCRTCVSFCPFGAVQVVQVQSSNGMSRRDKALKCDLCGAVDIFSGDVLDSTNPEACISPSCVAACPHRALIYLESEVA